MWVAETSTGTTKLLQQTLGEIYSAVHTSRSQAAIIAPASQLGLVRLILCRLFMKQINPHLKAVAIPTTGRLTNDLPPHRSSPHAQRKHNKIK